MCAFSCFLLTLKSYHILLLLPYKLTQYFFLESIFKIMHVAFFTFSHPAAVEQIGSGIMHMCFFLVEEYSLQKNVDI